MEEGVSLKRSLLGVFIAVSLAACSSGGGGTIPQTLSPQAGSNYKAACDVMAPGDTDVCFALVRTDVGGAPGAHLGAGGAQPEAGSSTPVGYGPSTLQAAYALPSSTAGSGQTVALIESGDYPTAQADLNTYRSEYGLPACGSGCFTKVSQTGSTTSLPAENASWAEESALDMDMVSAICPNCHILMVEANSATDANLAAAAAEAAKLGATEISNSYGGSESGASNASYSYSNIVVTASSGDSGYAGGVEQPCSYATVVCTGGSSLKAASNARGYTETVWNDLSAGDGAASSGCSKDVAKPAWQTDKGCTKRSESDVSFDADPENGVAVYDSTSYEGYVGWLEFGGTSVASPAIASVYALAGNAASLGSNAAQTIWNDAGSGLWSVTSGNNLSGRTKCGSAYPYICTAGTGDDGVYSGPTGWGTPDGLTDF
jgi:subtilase family serine protease